MSQQPNSEEAPTTGRHAAPGRHAIVVRDLRVHYGHEPVLEDIQLALPRGQITAIVGPSGCGKSTFLSTLNRMTDLIDGCKVQGSIELEGVEVLAAEINVVALRRRVGMIFQRPNPFPFSIARNLSVPLREHGVRDSAEIARRSEAALRNVGLWEEVANRMKAPAVHLSGGQQQRLCLARAIVLEPDVLLLDEPCSALDPQASAAVEELVSRLRGQLTVVIVTHNLAQARRIADHVALFWVRDGVCGVVEHAPTDEFFEAPKESLTRRYITGVTG